jgi:microcystin-dependent protein
MSEPFIGQIQIFPYNFAPRGWAFCQGQIMSIAQNTALFALLGTTFGGNGQTTFALPDLRSRIPVGAGQGPGLSSYDLGEQTGTETVTLTTNQMPAHAHPFQILANESDPNSKVPLNNFFCNNAANFYQTSQDGTKMGQQTTGIAGGNQPFGVIQPILCLNFCIALEGIFPSRN